jgi:hypothetical protein
MTVTADSLFTELILPLYPADVASNLEARQRDANPANNPTLTQHLDEAASIFVAMHARVLGADLGLDFTDASVHRLGRALTRDVRDRLLGSGPKGSADNALFNVIVHGTAYVGACVVRSHDGAWLVRRPLWESRVRLRSRAGEAELALLPWWLRSLADDAFDGAGLAERYRAYVEVPTLQADALPILSQPRPLPRLKSVRYDTLYKYLDAHLPEVRTVGADFPSPERFEEYRFRWLDFALVGEGRMLLIYGPGEGGLHAFWLDHAGFLKGALFPAPIGEAPEQMTVTVTIDREKIAFSVGSRTHEVLWWGP